MVRLSRMVAFVGFVALAAMIAVTCVDIGLRVVTRMPGGLVGDWLPAAVPGVVDWVELTLIIVAQLSIAVTFMKGTHVGVDLLGAKLPPRLRGAARRAGWGLSFVFMAACFVQACILGRAQFLSGVVSSTISLPLWWYWIAVVVGTGLSAIACAAHLLRPPPSADTRSR
jgi:Tripartite ATP-independent periplasmic transporters, DctQ component